MKILLLMLVALAALTGSLTLQPTPTRPNIVLIVADDLSPTLGCYGDAVVATPTIDSLARRGVLFERAFCTSPSCSPSRASMLTGRYPHQLAEGANLWGTLPLRYPNMVNLLERAGYRVGLVGKGWGPGNQTAGGYDRNPAGPAFSSVETFMQKAAGQPEPFFLWLGPSDPHRPYESQLKATVRLDAGNLRVPPDLPDTPEVRADLLDYYAETGRFEQTVADLIARLRRAGQLANTLLIVTSDNGMPFPRAKANLYDAGGRIPLVMAGAGFAGGRRIASPVSLVDLAPTILQVAGLSKPQEMVGQSLSRYQRTDTNQPVFLERERHAHVRAGNLGYPARAVRTRDFLFIQNLKPDRWPAGDPLLVWSVGPFGDIDGGPTKDLLVSQRDRYPLLASRALDKRPAEELYDLRKDPAQQRNVAKSPTYARTKAELIRQLRAWQQRTADPRLSATDDLFDTYPYSGGPAAKEA